mmetsp:Transcript_6349/g.15676  ORF Transcript_6349/g.15676 Transcript_6349/m.15676 type:complete len:105 (+) Transcript_6349:63-377(+)
MSDFFKKWQSLEVFCSGCRNECNQKCVIDNHEVEILHAPFQLPPCTDHAFCPSGRISSADFCTPRPPASTAMRNRSYSHHGPSGFPSGFECGLQSDRSYVISPR